MRMLSRFSVLLAAGSALFASGCALLSAVTGADDWTPQSRTGWIAVRPDNGVWDDEYGRTADPRDCSFEFGKRVEHFHIRREGLFYLGRRRTNQLGVEGAEGEGRRFPDR